ncbi:MAG TPA: hypothetical protein VFN97_03740 [Actinospica sp.]|nr:hypothetical protein [Actinospica sp.]
MRQKITLSAVSLVLIAVGATTAATLSASHNGAPQLTSATPHVTKSATAGPSASPSTAPTQTRTTTSSPSSTTPSSTGTGSSSGGTSSSQPASADPHQVRTQAWLTASEMPFAGSLTWNAQSSKMDSDQQLTSTIGYVANTANYQALTICGDPAAFMRQTIGAQIQAFDSTPASSGNNQATQYIFFFSSASAAQQGYAWLQDQYTSNCSGITSTGAQLTQVASAGSSGMAWLTEKASSGLPDLPLYDREYFVLRGDTIAYVSVTSYPHTLAKSYDDAGVLSTIAGHLCIYGGSCG